MNRQPSTARYGVPPPVSAIAGSYQLMDVRTAKEPDTLHLVDLWTEFMIELHGVAPATADRDAWASRLHRQIAKSQVCVTETGGALVGFAGVIDHSERDFIPPAVAYLADLYVTPNMRQRGVGSSLLGFVIEHVASCEYVVVWTNTSENNASARGCLARASFRPLDGFSLPHLPEQLYLQRRAGATLPPSEIAIRPMQEFDDLPVSCIVSDCYRLIAEPDGLTSEQRDRMIAERCQPAHMASHRARFTCHIAEQDARVVGFIAASGSDVEELFVDPKHHRRGIATALFRKVEADCQDSVLTVGTTGFGLPFYQAMGMQVTDSRLVTFGPLEGRQLIQLEKRRPNQ